MSVVEDHLFQNTAEGHPTFLESFDQVQGQFIVGAAKALFGDAWAKSDEEAVELYGDQGYESQIGPGVEIFAVMPEVPLYAYFAATHFMGLLEANNGKSIPVLIGMALEADGKQDELVGEEFWEYVRSFGHYTAMQAVGHGIGWFDFHKEFDLKPTGYDTIDLDAVHDLEVQASLGFSVDDDEL